jgi:hypothetical protein
MIKLHGEHWLNSKPAQKQSWLTPKISPLPDGMIEGSGDSYRHRELCADPGEGGHTGSS